MAPRTLDIRNIDLRTAVDRRAQIRFLERDFRGISLASWQYGEVQKIRGKAVSGVAEFAVAPGIYVIFNIDTTSAQVTLKARQIMLKIWERYCGDLGSLNVIAYWIVQNEDVRTAMVNAALAFQRAYVVPSIFNYWITIYPDHIGWREAKTSNPFIIGVRKMLVENSAAAGNASIASVEFIWDPLDPEETSTDFSNYELYMKINLRR